MVRSWIMYREGYILLEFDPSYGEQGEIRPRFIPCDEIISDKDAGYEDNPSFITIFEKQTVEELINRFPEKEQAILDELGIQRKGSKNMTQEVVTKKTYFTYFDPKERMAKEAVCIFFNNCMLGKYKDPNWLEGRNNFLKAPMKPIIPLNVINDGKHWVDFSSFIEDGIKMQRQLNNRGMQIARNAATANGTTIINGKTSGLTKEDAQNWTQRENQKIFLKKARDGVALDQMITNIPGKEIPQYVVQEKQDMRATLGMVMSVPYDQTGADETGDDPTLGQTLLKKTNAQGRQDMIVRGLDRFLHKYFNFLTQMMFVWYDEAHYFPYLDSDGSFENIIIKRYYFDEGMRVSVKGGTTIAFDKNREQALAIHMLEHNQLSYLDGYRILGFENPQKLYDNWAKQSKDAFELVRDADDAYDDGNAYAEFIEFMDGKEPKIKEDANENYILTLRKMMITDMYLNAKSDRQIKFAKRVQEYVDRFQLKHSLDQLGQEGLDKVPINNNQIPPPIPDQQFQQMMAPPPPPGMAPPAPPQGLGMPSPMQQPGQGAPMPPVQSTPGVFNGTPIPNPAAPHTPSGVSAIPAI